MILKDNLWAPLTTEVGLSPRDTDPNRAARLRIHGHGRAESHVLALHVARTGLFHARIVVSGGVHLGQSTGHECLGTRGGHPGAGPALRAALPCCGTP